MSDQEELKPCSFCGEDQTITYPFPGQKGQGSSWETHGVSCKNCDLSKASMNEWNNAYCWKELSLRDEKIKDLEAELKTNYLIKTETQKALVTALEKIKEQAKMLNKAIEILKRVQRDYSEYKLCPNCMEEVKDFLTPSKETK